MTRTVLTTAALGGLAFLGLTSPALAHGVHGATGTFLEGLAHPLHGWDHLLAVLAVGLWLACAPSRNSLTFWLGSAAVVGVALATGLHGAGFAGPSAAFALGLLVTTVALIAVGGAAGLAIKRLATARLGQAAGGLLSLAGFVALLG